MAQNEDRYYMRGHVWIREAITGYLQEALPSAIARMGESWDEELQVDVPQTWDAYDPYEVKNDEYPAVGVYCTAATGYTHQDHFEDGREYRSNWTVALSIATSSRRVADDEGVDTWEGRTATIDHCQDLTSAILGSILLKPSLISPRDVGHVVVDENSINVNYGQTTQLAEGSDRWIAQSLINMSVAVYEDTYEGDHVQVEVTEIEVRRMQ